MADRAPAGLLPVEGSLSAQRDAQHQQEYFFDRLTWEHAWLTVVLLLFMLPALRRRWARRGGR
jgi:hypothetical protein